MHTDHAPAPGSAVRVLNIALALIAIANGPANVAHAGGVDPTAPATSSWVWIVLPLGLALAGWAAYEVRKRRPANKQPSTPPSMGGSVIRSSGVGGLHPEPVSTDAMPRGTASKAAAAAGATSPPQRQTGRIFVSYRREDSGDVAGRVYDRLVERFGKPHVFKDVDSIPLGVDFRRHLQQVVGNCDVFLAIIGADWLRAGDSGSARRLDDAKDFVRIELESALQRNIPVIPVLVRGAEVPKESDLPAPLGAMAYRHGIAIRPDPDFHRDMDRLIEGVERHLTVQT